MRLRISDNDTLSVEDRTHFPKRAIGVVLSQRGLIDEADIDRILLQQVETGRLFGETAIDMGLIERSQLDDALEEQKGGASWDSLGVPTHAPFSPSVTLGDENFAAQIRAVLSALTHEQNAHGSLQRIVVTGVHMNDRARIVAASLATVSANSGYRVLLIDADFDRPSLHHMFRISNRLGLSTLLSSPDAPHHLPQATSIANLAVICAGPPVQNYSSIIARERVFHRLQPLARSFDYMIIDAGSLAPAQVARLSAGADNVVVAVKEHVSSLHDLANMVQILQAEGVPHPAVLMIE